MLKSFSWADKNHSSRKKNTRKRKQKSTYIHDTVLVFSCRDEKNRNGGSTPCPTNRPLRTELCDNGPLAGRTVSREVQLHSLTHSLTDCLKRVSEWAGGRAVVRSVRGCEGWATPRATDWPAGWLRQSSHLSESCLFAFLAAAFWTNIMHSKGRLIISTAIARKLAARFFCLRGWPWGRRTLELVGSEASKRKLAVRAFFLARS